MPEVATQTLPITCRSCQAAKEVRPLKDGSAGLPPGWKRLQGESWCADCWRAAFVLRNQCLPVASVLGPEGEDLVNEAAAAAWAGFRAACRDSWRQAARASTWAITEIAKADNTTPEQVGGKWRLPKLEAPTHLYAGARALCPELDSQSVGSLLQRVRKRYLKVRWNLRGRQAVSVPTYRNPEPVPIPAKDYRLSVSARKQARITLRVSGRRFGLRLAGGASFRRQISPLEKAVRGELLLGEALLYEQASGGGHQNGSTRRRQPGANRHPTRVMLGIAVWVPRDRPKADRERVLVVRTATDKLWEVFLDGREEPWNLHAGHICGWAAEHRRKLQALSDDTKLERRIPRAARADLNGYRERVSAKYHRRLHDFCHKAAALLAGFARRGGVTRVEYNDTGDSFLPEFPWFKLRQLCREKIELFGATFVEAESSANGEGD